MDIPFKAVDEKSVLSSKPFMPGDRVWSCLYRTEEGIVERADVLEEEREQLKLDSGILCQWVHLIKERETTEAEVRKAELQSAEEVFLSLYDDIEEEGEDSPETIEARERLKFFLALQLERKRVLKPIGSGKFRHLPTKREFQVPRMELTPELVAAHLKQDDDAEVNKEDDTEVVPPEE